MAMLTVRQAADRLGVGYSTLKQWIYKGSVRTTRTEGGHHRIAETEVERLLAKLRSWPAPSRGGPVSKTPHRLAWVLTVGMACVPLLWCEGDDESQTCASFPEDCTTIH